MCDEAIIYYSKEICFTWFGLAFPKGIWTVRELYFLSSREKHALNKI